MLHSTEPILLKDFGKQLKRPYRTVWRWWRVGLLNRDTGERVYLETWREPTGRCTSSRAYQDFRNALNRIRGA